MIDDLPTFLSLPLLNPNAKNCLLIMGKNRATIDECQIRANNDIEAVQCWLNEYQSVTTTYRAYKKETYRLLLWCAINIQKTLSDLTRDDFEHYSQFLIDPQPRYLWCGARSQNITNWKPFVGSLSLSARRTAMTILNSLMEYLVQADYLKKNPLALLRKKIGMPSEQLRKIKSLERKLEPDEISTLLNTIESMPENSDREIFNKYRTRFLVYLLSLTGMRDNELITHHWDNFHNIQKRWWLFVVGKGNKPRLIPITDELLKEIKRYRLFLKKPPYPLRNDTSPLVSHYQNNNVPITARQINNILRQIVGLAAEHFIDQPEKFQRMKRLSAHWFRHINATLQEQADISVIQIRDNMGHSDIKTTSIYLHSSDLARHTALQKVKLSK